VKVLQLPSNIASQPNVTVRALRDVGVEARRRRQQARQVMREVV
jgi:hypothetical protein